jgi:hypothetical protein
MTPEERRQLIKRSHANKVRQQVTGPALAFTPDQVAATLARIEAAEIAHGRAQYERRLADFEEHKRKPSAPPSGGVAKP